MEKLLLIFLIIPTAYINYKIIKTDITEKRIPNIFLKYLLYLILPIYIYLAYYGYFSNLFLLHFFIEIIIALIICLTLFYFWIWGAWDAKYLLVLSLFIPYIGIIPLVWNIALVVILYSLLFIIWWFFIKIIINKKHRGQLSDMLIQDLKWKWIEYVSKKLKNSYIKMLSRTISSFLLLFATFKFIKIYSWFYIISQWAWGIEKILSLEKYMIYATVLSIWLLIWWLIYLYKMLAYRIEKSNKNYKSTFFLITLIIFIGFISHGLYTNPHELVADLYKISTFYLILYILIKSSIYIYKLGFAASDEKIIQIDKLSPWDQIDKKYLRSFFRIQFDLRGTPYEKEMKTMTPISFFWDVDTYDYVDNLSKNLNKQEVEEIKSIYQKMNTLHLKRKTTNFQHFDTIKIINSLAFAPYIFLGFITTVLFGNTILLYVALSVFHFIQQFYS